MNDTGVDGLTRALHRAMDAGNTDAEQWRGDAEVIFALFRLDTDDDPHMTWEIVRREDAPDGSFRFAVNGVELWVDDAEEGPSHPKLWDPDHAIGVMFDRYWMNPRDG
jgi:hypothetical protein